MNHQLIIQSLEIENSVLKERLARLLAPKKLGRPPVKLSETLIARLDWNQPNRVIASELNVTTMTVIKLRKMYNINPLPRGRPND